MAGRMTQKPGGVTTWGRLPLLNCISLFFFMISLSRNGVQSFVIVLIRFNEITLLERDAPFLKRRGVVLYGSLILVIQLGDVEFFELGDRLGHNFTCFLRSLES